MTQPKGQIAVVALGMSRVNSDAKPNSEFDDFSNMTATEKMAAIKQRIIAACEQLKEKEPDAMWLVAWREYGITDKLDRSVSNQFKREFLKEMQALCEIYPNLAVLAGTMSTRREITKEKLAAVEKLYASDEYAKLFKIEEKDRSPQLQSHYDAVKKYLDPAFSDELYMLRNTAYFISKDGVLRHDKLTPFDETEENPSFPHSVYRPAKGEKHSPLMKVKHTVTGEEVLLGVEICREHDFAILKEAAAKSQSSPMIQFVLSDPVKPNLENACAEHLIPLDSTRSPKLIHLKDPETTVRLYQTDLLKKDTKLRGPIKSLYPFERRVIEVILQMMKYVPAQSEARKRLERMQDKFKDDIAQMKPMSFIYDDLREELHHIALLYQRNTSWGIVSTVYNSVTTFFSSAATDTNAIMKKWIKHMYEMINAEERQNPMYKDILAYSDSPLMTEYGQAKKGHGKSFFRSY